MRAGARVSQECGSAPLRWRGHDGVVVERIRTATADDAHAIAAVHVAGWQQGYRGLVAQGYLDVLCVEDRERDWARALDRGGVVLVHEDAGRVDAFACYGPCRDPDVPAEVGEVHAFYVHPASWGSGIAGRLLAAAVADLPASAASAPGPGAPLAATAGEPVAGSPAVGGPAAPVLWVLEGNQRARRSYERQGWAADGSTRQDQRPALGGVPGIAFTEVRYRLRVRG